MSYTAVYEVSPGYDPGWGLMILTLLAVAALGWAIYTVLHHKKFRWSAQILPYFLAVFFGFIACTYWISFFQLRNTVLQPYLSGDYQVVEGAVEDFEVTYKDGEELYETFTVEGLDFEIPDSWYGLGYSVLSTEGGAIQRDGQHVRIRCVRYNDEWNLILKLEVSG
jgi:hypothetical protein